MLHAPQVLQAVFVAVKNKMDLSIAVALGSSIQVCVLCMLCTLDTLRAVHYCGTRH